MDSNSSAQTAHSRKEVVILVHGLWMTGFEFIPIYRHLKRCGYTPRRFPYSDMRRGLAENAKRLHAFASRIEADKIHFVAHSLGGVVLMEMFRLFPEQRSGRALALGSPLMDSWTARKVSRWPVVGPLLGRTMRESIFSREVTYRWDLARDFGVIAGTYPRGAGRILGMQGPCDGTVLVEETLLPGATDHIALPASHFGLLLDRSIQKQVVYFLQEGRFFRNGIPILPAEAYLPCVSDAISLKEC